LRWLCAKVVAVAPTRSASTTMIVFPIMMSSPFAARLLRLPPGEEV
jgi:hypothetical protein